MKYCPQCARELMSRVIDGVNRLACSSSECGFVHWNNPIPVVAGIVQHEGKYIIARNAKWPSGMFSMITGFLEKGETPEQAIFRETHEELGLRGESLEFIGHYAFLELNQLVIAFAVKAHGNLAPSEEIAEVKMLSKSELETYDFGRLKLTSKIVAQWLQMLDSASQRDPSK